MNEIKIRKAQGDRLAAARKAAGFKSARAAALECGWPESSYRAHEAGGRTIGQDDAERYARKFHSRGVKVTAQMILFGDNEASKIHGPPLPAKSRPREVVNSSGEKIGHPEGSIREVDSRAGLGGGQHVPDAYESVEDGWRVVDAMKPEPWIFPPSFVRSGFGAPVSKILAMTTQGESMSPTINHGDVVFIDTTHQRISPPGLYAMRDVYGEIIVKRLEAYRDQGEPMVRIESDNPSHGPRFERLSEIHVVGRICGMVKLI